MSTSRSIWGLLAACLLASALPAEAQEMAPEECPACHGGTLEALADKTKDYKTEFDENVNPHVYVDKLAAKPHQSKVLPECIKCHKPHPMPPVPGMKVEKADLQ